jgi:GDP/UDP-N,N'-diacetylbacillosamine 2-epimerase (hydrolysing)
MGAHSMNIGVLTSSRADFGIYLPLLKKMRTDTSFNTKLIVFGSHLSRFHGYTLREIEAEGFTADYKIETLLAGDSAETVATSMSLCMMKFSQFWGTYAQSFDLVFCLGDRYEMFAAVFAGVPFGIKFAHLHGGEQTLGAIDNYFRHAISHASWCHFTSTDQYAKRLGQLLDVNDRIFNVGSLSLDSLTDLPLLTKEELTQKFGVRFDKPVVLLTFHPETVGYESNVKHANILCELMISMPNFYFVVTLPNTDTTGNAVRSIFYERLTSSSHVLLLDNFGLHGYFSMMNHAQFLLGNSSSGIIEAASFGKFVINLGERQKGRLQSANVINVPVSIEKMKIAINEVVKKGFYEGVNIYFQRSTAENIVTHIKQILVSNGN